MTKSKTLARWWAIANTGGWGEGATIAEAVQRAAAGGYQGSLGWRRTNKGPDEGFQVHVFELDQEYPVTHTDGGNGHAIHRPAGSTPGQMGRCADDVRPYRRDAEGKVIGPRRFMFRKGARSEAGLHLTLQVR